MKELNILVTDSVILNTGDAAILTGLIKLIKRAVPHANIRVHCAYYDDGRKIYRELFLGRSLAESTRCFSPRFFWRFDPFPRYLLWAFFIKIGASGVGSLFVTGEEKGSLEDYDWADVIVSCGGSFLTDTYYFLHVLNGYRVGLLLKKKMAILGQSIGPFNDEDCKRRVVDVVQRFDLVVVRDKKSHEVLREAGVRKERMLEAPDMAFLHRQDRRKFVIGHLDEPKVGVSVRRWVYPGVANRDFEHSSYVKRMAATLDELIEGRRASIQMISTCQGVKSYAFHDDQVAQEIVSHMRNGDQVRINDNFHTPVQFMKSLQGIDLLIGTRMHACILAMISGIPAINIEYEFKSRELYRHMGLLDFVLPVREFQSGELVATTRRMLDELEYWRGHISRRLDEFGEQFSDVRVALRKMLESS